MTTITVEFGWTPVEDLRYDGDLDFPSLQDAPGIYRFVIEAPDGGARRIYIGETDRLRRRMQHYRTPGVTQRTNIRLREALTAAMARGSRVSRAVITEASVSIDGAREQPLDLARKTSRLIVENAAIAAVMAEHHGDPHGLVLLNRPGVGEVE